jgi:ATP-binding cassette, subfamily G (WHITE), member 2, PDR
VVVLYEGRQIYFGPKDAAKEYFVDLGYHCPGRQTTADFLTSITNPAERRIREGFENKVPRSPEDFAKAWRDSETRAQLLREIDAFEGDSASSKSNLEELKAARKLEQASLM